MSNQPWHADADLIGAYARGQLDAAAEASVETHVTRCPSCRAVAAEVVAATASTDSGLPTSVLWDAVATRIAAPRTGPVGRALQRLGVSEPDLVVLRSSRSLAVPFALSLLAALCFAFLAGQLSAAQQRGWLLLVAPLVPALLVAAAYDLTDPLRGISDSTPLSQVRVALLRTIVAVAAAVPVVALLARVPQVGLSPSAWLLPSLTLTVLTLVLLTRWPAPVAVGAVATAWTLAVAAMSGLASTTVAGAWPFQLALLVLLALVTAAWLARLGLLTPTEVRP
jgi:anti-sigma factor RsiW